MSKEQVSQLLVELKSGLAALYGSRLRGVFLYGSYARQEQDPESDLDILIILSDVQRHIAQIERTGQLVRELSLKCGVSISRKFLSEIQWNTVNSALLRNIRAEAIAA